MYNSDFELFEKFDDLDIQSQNLINAANEATHSSYSPYSNFRVGAAVLLENGEIIMGSNQENAAYPSGLCAERVALFQTGARFPQEKIKAMAVVAKKGDEDKFNGAGPCGACRQVMLEYENKQGIPFPILFLAANNYWVKAKNSKSLLPYSFSKDNL